MPNIIVMVTKYYLLSEDIVPFTTTDIEVMAEFLKIVKPVSCALDKLQSEKNAYMGVLLPTLDFLRQELYLLLYLAKLCCFFNLNFSK